MYNGFCGFAVKKNYLTTMWAVCLAVLLAILIVGMNALAAAGSVQNVVSFYPAEEQIDTACTAYTGEYAPETAK